MDHSRLNAQDSTQINHALSLLEASVARGGPDPDEYASQSELFHQLYICGAQPQQVAAVYAATLHPDCLHGHAYLKPHGYAGDFEIIDRVYTGRVSADPKFARHDRYFQDHAAAKAVRNRKQFFKCLLLQHAAAAQGPVRVLNIACGPARDVFEFCRQWPDTPVTVHCVDVDAKALEYAAALCSAFAHKVSFEQANALRLHPHGSYDLIWSAGLFDYLADHWFTALVRRYLAFVAPGGELVIGNFSPHNPTRPAMELLCDWYLQHRSARQLRDLAVAAGAVENLISVDQEPEGVNLFLRVPRTAGL